MPIFPFPQYPYMNRFYSRNNIYSQKNNYNAPGNNKTNSINESDTLNNDIQNNRVENINCTNLNEDISSLGQNKSSRYSVIGPIHFQNPFSMNSDEPIIEILGISLYLDDIIILGLLFFLYQEGVKDYMLFMALIMLLLS